MKRTFCISAAAAVLLTLSACAATPTSNVDNIPPAAQTQENHSAPAELDRPENAASDIPASKTTLTVTAGGQEFTVTLADNESARRLLDLLPLTLDMSELNGNEKFFYLDTELPADPYQPGQINAGDLMLYGDNCLVLFYESFPSGYSYTRLGSVDDSTGLAEALGTSGVEVTFTLGGGK